ncbi:Facilitated trehalose transporter Tret1-2 [Orchesella cincta]|uniref:Facilitated trehalose transporter Tret1-2 n=1 Tax=Orchesella cincta TaxID=48709 RepID=A0A1D2M780_ORCCI|nr:Facilitated trehalose transporter Tret1-2 [Orchesella cincta]
MLHLAVDMDSKEIEEGTITPQAIKIVPFQSKIRPQIITTLIACVEVGTVLTWTSPALPDLEKRNTFGGLTISEKSWIASAVTFGAIFSGPLAGYILDRVGRRKSMVFLSFPLIIGWVLIAFSPSVVFMSIGRFLTGIAIGGYILVCNVYLAEISEQRIRGTIMTGTCIALGGGMLLTYVLGTFFSWFVLSVVNICISIIILLTIRTVPESPVYLIHKGDKKKAGKELMRLRGATEFQQIELELNELQSSTLKVETQAQKSTESPSLWRNLTRRGSLKAIGITFALMVFQQLCGVNAVIFFAATIFSAAQTNLDANVCAIIIGVDILFAVFLTSFLIDKLGRRMLLFISLLGLTVCLSCLGVFFYLQRKNDGITPSGISWVPLVCLMLFMILYNIGIGPLGPASAAATSFNWLLAFVVTKTFEDFINLFGIHMCFWFFAAICFIGFVFCLLFVPETKGKTLDEIQRQYFTEDKKLYKQ